MRKPKSDVDQARTKEDAYFHARDAELIQQMKQKEAAQKQHAELKQASGIADDALVAELRACGYDRETVKVLHLVPLLQVAWADGEIAKEEREHILEAARAHGVEPESRAYKRLESWLDQRPADAFFRKSLRAVHAMLHALEPEHKHNRKIGLLQLSQKVAAASGGFLGIGSKVSAAERAVLAELTSEIERAHGEAAKAMAESLKQPS